MTKPNWYVVYTKSRCELKVANILSKKHIKNYCPLYIAENQLQDSKKQIFEPLFTSYVFVNIQEDQLTYVLNTPGIINCLYWLNKPAVVPEEEMDALIRLLKDHNSHTIEKHIIKPNKNLSAANTDLCDNDTPVSGKQVRLLLPSLGFCIIAKPLLAV